MVDSASGVVGVLAALLVERDGRCEIDNVTPPPPATVVEDVRAFMPSTKHAIWYHVKVSHAQAIDNFLF